MELDLLLQLNRYINSQQPFAKSILGVLDTGESVSVMAMPGGAETVYFDGTRDKQQQVQINAKSKEQNNCIDFLSTIFQKLENLVDLPSANGSYEFNDIKIMGMPSLILIDEQGYFIYQLSISVQITIFKGVL
ncbi:phage tail terminator protein [Metasolibacillus meyeri]|uniref:phage tail terminator protein n=1 Tax=Metasolibacillus meyeri TaxID=1071052 RepID=UPI00187D5704|nr:minor capsid protein [Metasolibacillus meyeri]